MSMKLPDWKTLVLSAVLALPLAIGATAVHAEWRLDSDLSQLSYTTTKIFPNADKSAAENNRFTKLEGNIGDDGSAVVSVALDSVNTNVAIRDERMRKLVFRR